MDILLIVINGSYDSYIFTPKEYTELNEVAEAVEKVLNV